MRFLKKLYFSNPFVCECIQHYFCHMSKVCYKAYVLHMFIQLFLCFLSIYLLFSYLLFFPKLLQRLLDDRKSTVEVIKREGEKIAATAEPPDKVKILKQLSLLDSRWEALLSKAETR